MRPGRRTFGKWKGEAPRVAPSRAKAGREEARAKVPRTKMPLVVVANSPDKDCCAGGIGKVEEQTSSGGGTSGCRRRIGGFHARAVFYLDTHSSESSTCA